MPSERTSDTAAPTRSHKRLIQIAIFTAILLILALTPPLINVNRLRRRIATSMSQSLGRPVHLDRVSLHLLPIPGFTLENLVVSEDPAFGYEPVIRANRVEATLRISSLWRRQVEFSTIRFDVDQYGSGPSLNIVRNAAGHWNLEQILTQAAHAHTAPTAQTKAGPAPRFPYIEATGARVNLKFGDEKMPFSLTDADFALWLPQPDQWHVRLQGRPARTDTNASDTGLLRLEGILQRAAKMSEVPVDLRASWNGTPLGEASRLVTGSDMGWRGFAGSSATLTGTLGNAQLTTSLHLADLRRADFIPYKSLDVIIDCKSQADVTLAILHDPSCSVDDDKLAAAGGKITAIADTLTFPAAPQGLRIGTAKTPISYFLDWARLFSPDIPATLNAQGDLSGSITYAGPPDPNPGFSGQAQGTLLGRLPTDTAATSAPHPATGIPATGNRPANPTPDPTTHPFGLIITPNEVTLAAIDLAPPNKPPLTLTGAATPSGYTLHLLGTANPGQVRQLGALMPPFAEGLDAILPFPGPGDPTLLPPAAHASAPPQSTQSATHFDITCTRVWFSGQTCTTNRTPPPSEPKSRKQLSPAARRSRAQARIRAGVNP
jgi:hypothetical protein